MVLIFFLDMEFVRLFCLWWEFVSRWRFLIDDPNFGFGLMLDSKACNDTFVKGKS